MTTEQIATNPSHSATVSASAGSGKTWMLVSRLIRLLLNGARPESILAVTFTRKAAAEMQTRLNARLLELASCPDDDLQQALTGIGASIDPDTCQKARTLYETLLSAPVGVRASTFHSFCQDILQRFPLEAGIAPGFELLESNAEFRQAAWDALCAEASSDPEAPHARAIENLFDLCGGLENTRTALNQFLEHRSDWWAFTEHQPDPLAFAITTLTGQLGISPEENILGDFFLSEIGAELDEFAILLDKLKDNTNRRHLELLQQACNHDFTEEQRFAALTGVFFTTQGTPRKREHKKTWASAMGEDSLARFLELHVSICDAILAVKEKLNSLKALHRIIAWYQAGARLLEHFQRLKAEQRVLDFSDLEWQAYQLLNHSDNVHWIQYKLDQRIDHLLIDEFQDTNPTQWRLVLPLLQELASGNNDRARSVFIVGDSKQSIYRFRRADPVLFDYAQDWLQSQLGAVNQPLDISWRSADAIIEFVNTVFGGDELKQQLVNFTPHKTHHRDLFGQVELLPLIQASETSASETGYRLRNPLQEPRIIHPDQRHYQEGRLIASRILELVRSETLVDKNGEERAVRYNDIMILLRQRTHIADYEQALREAGIPYNSANRGTLLDSQEASDLVDLLTLLVTPYNDLALAGLLRSPIFSCTEQDLIDLASQSEGDWIDRLTLCADETTCSDSLKRARNMLSRWQGLVDTLPVHDLLDRIFNEGDIINRYRSAYPVYLQHRVVANLTRFLELALEVDSGRYPTIGHFIARLQSLHQQQLDAPDEGVSTDMDSRVNIMTIHASKGLEAPVVFLADAANTGAHKDAYHAVIDWPTDAERPQSILLAGKKEEQDVFTGSILEQHSVAEARENANLFYVAVTRARQFLYISASEPRSQAKLGWYGMASNGLRKHLGRDDVPMILQSGRHSGRSPAADKPATATPEIDPRLGTPLHFEVSEKQIAPSQADTTAEYPTGHVDPDNQTRGITIHRMLELLCEGQSRASILKRVSVESGLAQDTPSLDSWFAEARRTVEDADLAELFDTSRYLQAFNEVPIQFRRGKQLVFGIIDRVVISGDSALIVDYKTQPVSGDAQSAAAIARHYQEQIGLYCEGASRLWPDKAIRGAILFTSTQQLVDVQNE